MSMQDKEIDQLFRSELYDLGMEPAADVWGNVKASLDANKRKRFTTAWLSVAASIAVLVVAGWFLIPQIKVNGKKPQQMIAVKNNISTKAIIGAEAKPVNTKNEAIAFVIKPGKVKVKSVVTKKPSPVSGLKLQRQEEQLATVTYRNRDVLHAVVPDAETSLSITHNTDNEETFKTKINAPVTQLPQVASATRVKKRRLSTLGDLINVVVSKVDKRKDKLIEFTNSDDDDDATITGINLGIIKIKKQD